MATAHPVRVSLTLALVVAWLLLPPAGEHREGRPGGSAAHAERTLEICRLEADPRNMFTSVPPPAEFAMRARLRLSRPAVAPITVNYTGFTPEAEAAFQYAVGIWESQLTSSARIVVNASFEDLGATTLGSAGAAWIFRDFANAVPGTWYAKALANKLVGADISPSSTPEISARFSSTFAWYFGTDGNPPAGQYDFVSVVLHELGHGLGFYGSATVSSGIGGITRSGLPDIYDRFVENGAGQPILGFTSGSAALAAQLTSDNLHWNGTNGRAANGGVRPRLYAPAEWKPGSSYSHLDENTYPPANANSLMTYRIGAAEAIHDPGPVVRGIFADEGWTTQGICAYSLSSGAASFAQPGGTGSVDVTAGAGCGWTATSNATWITISSGASGSGNGTVSYSVASIASGSRTGTMTIAGQTFTVRQGPTLAALPTTLSFGAVTNGTSLVTNGLGQVVVTPPQEITLSQTGTGTVGWTATSNQPWLQVTSGSGTGAGRFSAGIVASTAPVSAGTVTGTITVSAPGAASDLTIPVSLNVSDWRFAERPFGQVDTPLQNATGVAGSIGVTGWVLDNVAISSVKLYRNCLPFEPLIGCQANAGTWLVYMGDADIVPGARPDVETAFPTTPQASRAGWGFLLLTNMLPHVPTQQMHGGQGSLSIYVYATDIEGHRKLLGRSTSDEVPTTITMANDTATKPFGAIDTPGQGQTVSGALWNFGWALTPDGNTSADATDILVPTNGTTMWVFIDGAPVSTVTYNLCRGTVGSPPPAGVHCDDDVSSIFGNPTPQATHTPRAANPTKYRNLDAGRGAIGAYFLNTAGLSNGRHSIAWSVTDSSGRADGIGSRYFTVLNSGSLEAAVEAPGRIVGDAASVASLAVATTQVFGRTGFDMNAPWETVEPDDAGTRHVRLAELGRLELWLGADVTEGYLPTNGTLRPLPGGSRLANGRFTWAPPVGYIGTYDLVFVAGSERIPVRVTMHAAATPSRIDGYIDAPLSNATITGRFTVAGWAAEQASWTGSGIGAVHVWAHRRDGVAFPMFLGAAEMNVPRPDVAAQLGAQFERAGWQLAAPALPPGEYDVVAYFWRTRTQRFEDARVISVTAR